MLSKTRCQPNRIQPSKSIKTFGENLGRARFSGWRAVYSRRVAPCVRDVTAAHRGPARSADNVITLEERTSMNVPPASIPFLQDATERRWWLLVKALECAPLDRAIELALQAEAFVCAAIAPRADAPIGEREITAAEFSASPELALPTV